MQAPQSSLTTTESPAPFDPSIDDTSLRYRVRVDNELYTNFVEPKNFKTNIVVSAVEASYGANSNGLILGDGESHELILAINTIYSDRIEHGYDEMKLVFSNVQYSADPLLTNGGRDTAYTGICSSFNTAEAGEKAVDNLLGIPCPYIEGISGLACDPLMVLCSEIRAEWGSNSTPSSTKVFEPVVQAELLHFDRDELRKCDRLLLPDVVPDYEFLRRVSLFQKSGNFVNNIKGNPTADPVVPDTTTLFRHGVKRPAGCLVSEVASNQDNIFGIDSRYRRADSVVFSKAIPSVNYTYKKTAGVWEATDPLQTLHTLEYAGVRVPSYCSQQDFEDSGISIWQAMFYFDKQNKTFGTVGASNEPPNQYLIQTVTWKNITGNLRLQELKTFQPRSFHNVTRLKVIKTHASNKRRVFKTIIPWEADITRVVKTGTEVSLPNVIKYPQMKNVSIDVQLAGPYLRMKAFKMSGGLKLSNTSVISYINKNIRTFPLSMYLGGKPINEYKGRIYHQLNTLPLHRMPKARMFIASLYGVDNLDGTVSPLSMATFKKMTFSLNNDRPLCQTYNEKDLLRMTQKNGLKQCSMDALFGKFVKKPNVRISTFGAGAEQGRVIQHDESTFDSCIGALQNVQNGFPVLLKMGEDIPLPEGLSAGVVGLQLIEDITFELEAPYSSSKELTVYMIDFYDELMLINSEGNAVVTSDEINLKPSDSLYAMNLWKAKTASGALYVNVSSVNGGSWFSSAVNRVSSMLPKVLPIIRKGIDFYDKNRDTIHSAMNSASSGNTRGAVSSLASLLKN